MLVIAAGGLPNPAQAVAPSRYLCGITPMAQTTSQSAIPAPATKFKRTSVKYGEFRVVVETFRNATDGGNNSRLSDW